MELVLTILLGLLKIAGIFLVFLAAFVLLVLLIVLCTPIRYQISLGKKEGLLYGGQVSWLFRLLRFTFSHTEAEDISEINIFGLYRKREVKAVARKEKAAKLEEDIWQTDWQTMEEDEFKQKLFEYLSEPSKPESKSAVEAQTEKSAERLTEGDTAEEGGAKPERAVEAQTEKSAERPIKSDTAEEGGAKPERAVEAQTEKSAERLTEGDTAKEGGAKPERAVEAQTGKSAERLTEGDTAEEGGAKPERAVEARTQKSAERWIEDEPEEGGQEEPAAETGKKKNDWQTQLDNAWWIFDKLRAYLRENSGFFRHIMRWVFRMLRSALPKRADGKVELGLQDPAHTGTVLALFYLFYPENRGKIEVIPDFEVPRFSGEAVFAGRILLIELIYYALRLALDIRFIRLLLLVRTLKAGRAKEELKKKKTKEWEEIPTSASAGG